MAKSAKADGKGQSGVTLTAVVARRKKDGQVVVLFDQGGKSLMVEYPLDSSADHALDLYDRLKKSKGENGRYTHASLFLLSRSRRGNTKFA
jgi:hypothetical protein